MTAALSTSFTTAVSSGGTAGFGSTYAYGPLGGVLTTATTQGATAYVQTYDPASTRIWRSDTNYAVFAITLEGIRLTGNCDFTIGFPGLTSNQGGVYLYQPYGQALPELRYYQASGGTLYRVPRSVTDCTATSGSATITSATANFVSTDVGSPVTQISGASSALFVPGTVIESVVSATQATVSIPAIGTSSANGNLSIGVSPIYTALMPGITASQNLTFLLDGIQGIARLMSDDQVLTEWILTSDAPNWGWNQSIIAQAGIVNQSTSGAAATMSWHKTEFIMAHN